MNERTDDTTERLRTPPAERFSGDIHDFDLSATLSELRREDHPAKDGHRQITIFRRAPVTHVLFAFDPGGRLAEHSTTGLVTIHVLEGRLRVRADAEEHDLPAGRMLILSPGVPHDVRALESSAMLLTVHLQDDDATT